MHRHDHALATSNGVSYSDDDDDYDQWSHSTTHLSSLVQGLDRDRAWTWFSPSSNRFIFFGWFLVVGYYYSSRFKILESEDIPWALSFIQGVVCVPLILLFCLIRRRGIPLDVDRRDLVVLGPLAVVHTLCHLAVFDINAKTPSTLYFYEAVRVTEPFWTAIAAKHFLDEEYSKRDYAYLSLFVMALEIGGFYFFQYKVDMLFYALVVTLASSLRSVLALRALRTLPRFSSISDLFFVTTLMSTALVCLLTLVVDGTYGFKDMHRLFLLISGMGRHRSGIRILFWIFLCCGCFLVKNYLLFCFVAFCNSAVRHCFGTTFVMFLGRRFALLSPFLFFIPILALPELIGSVFAAVAVWLFLRHRRQIDKQRRRALRKARPAVTPGAWFSTSATELRSRHTR